MGALEKLVTWMNIYICWYINSYAVIAIFWQIQDLSEFVLSFRYFHWAWNAFLKRSSCFCPDLHAVALLLWFVSSRKYDFFSSGIIHSAPNKRNKCIFWTNNVYQSIKFIYSMQCLGSLCLWQCFFPILGSEFVCNCNLFMSWQHSASVDTID